MELARYVVDAVVLEGRSYREVAAAHGVSKSWVAKVVMRYRQGGYEAIGPQSRAPHRTPHRTPPDVEDAIVRLRKELLELGHDAGATTIDHLEREIGHAPAISTVHRVLVRRGFIVPEPPKRPRSSWQRFEAALPNECWQSDVTHWKLADDTEVQIVNFIDDHSRLCVASVASITVTAVKVVDTFVAAGSCHGFPSRLLTDNGCVYTTWHRGGPNAMQLVSCWREASPTATRGPIIRRPAARWSGSTKHSRITSPPDPRFARSKRCRSRSMHSLTTTTRCVRIARLGVKRPQQHGQLETKPSPRASRLRSAPAFGFARIESIATAS